MAPSHRLPMQPLIALIIVAFFSAIVGWGALIWVLNAIIGVVVAIWSFWWYKVLPWPDCGYPIMPGDSDPCAAMGVIYAPLTFVLVIATIVLPFFVIGWIIRNW